MSGRDVALTLFVVVSWGIGFAVAKPAVEHFPPIFLMTACFALTALLMQAMARGEAATTHLRVAAIAFFAVTLQAALIFKGLQGLPASTAVLVAQTQVPMAVLWAWALRTEPFNAGKLAAALGLALLGVMVIVGLPAEPPPLGPLLTLLAGNAAWGLGQVLIARLGADQGAILLRRVALHGAGQLLVATILLETGQLAAIGAAGAEDWAALGFVAVFGFALAYVLWFGLIRRNPVSAVTPFVMLMPIISIVTAVILLGERPGWPALIGGALIILGVVFASGMLSRSAPGLPRQPAA